MHISKKDGKHKYELAIIRCKLFKTKITYLSFVSVSKTRANIKSMIRVKHIYNYFLAFNLLFFYDMISDEKNKEKY